MQSRVSGVFMFRRKLIYTTNMLGNSVLHASQGRDIKTTQLESGDGVYIQ